MTMTTEPHRPDIARDLLDRAEAARLYRSKLTRGQLGPAELDLGRHGDRSNASVLRRIVEQHGWPGRSLVGEDGGVAAWQIALHADQELDLQRPALRAIATAVERGEAAIQQWAHLYDRCCVNAGQRQVYGTQHRYGHAGVEVLPVREPENLDARRASVGLPPFATAQEAVRRRYAREPETDQAEDAEHSGAAPLMRTAA
ncbi:DUF6624 domain-containing protein [Streptomyces lunaelactis]|uniref:DUF6624 domain-containing protein n=1 Tax=Streptomyces lunaelactis TaxID=1535768 RepID=UPI001584BCC5|nr:DUF6624 domain-containing protein [Streptomyces lunaelactis]NUK14043.1 hypothetical protein [Streptomyces lunaelactis]